MITASLAATYRNYIACLNRQDWTNLGRFVADDVRHNGRTLGLEGYRDMLENDFQQIPDLRFDIRFLLADPSHIAARLWFEVTPKALFLGLPVNGRKVCFAENVFYEYRDSRIHEVCSVIDKAAIEAQLAG